MDHILAVETSSKMGSICLAHQGQVIFEASCHHERSHTEWITLELERQLAAHHFSLSKIDAFAVTTGPGSFTGLRIGVNLIRSLGFCLDRPVLATNTLELLASPHFQKEPRLWSVLPAFRDLLYVSKFENGQAVMEPSAVSIEDFKSQITVQEALVLGSPFSPSLHHQLSQQARLLPPSEVSLARLLTQLFFNSPNRPRLKWWELKPLYVRASEAEEKLRRGLIRSPSEW